uniref:Uncharacterized protein n=1 Tax=Salix viminalis TaxID=40686 RepID=A0A6N2L5M3_SALVM
MKVGRSFRRISFNPGIQSIFVSKYPFVKSLSSASLISKINIRYMNKLLRKNSWYVPLSGGTTFDELSLARSLRNGTKHAFEVESQRNEESWVTSASI